jgi:hypothetical protein
MEELLSPKAHGIMTIKEAAEFLGIPEQTLRRYRKNKGNPVHQGFFLKIPGGRRVWVDTAAVNAARETERNERVAAAEAMALAEEAEAEAEATDDDQLDDAA